MPGTDTDMRIGQDLAVIAGILIASAGERDD